MTTVAAATTCSLVIRVRLRVGAQVIVPASTRQCQESDARRPPCLRSAAPLSYLHECAAIRRRRGAYSLRHDSPLWQQERRAADRVGGAVERASGHAAERAMHSCRVVLV